MSLTIKDVQHAKTRDDLVAGYMDMITLKKPVSDVNRAIIARWSPSALNYIKKRAWDALTPYGARSPRRPHTNRSRGYGV